MTGPQILIAAIIIALVIAFIVTMLFVNAQTSKIIDSNVKLAESQNTLLTQNKTQTDLLEKLEEQTASHLVVRFFSTRTNLILFTSSIR